MTSQTELDGLQEDCEAILCDVLASILEEEVLPAYEPAQTGLRAVTRLAIHDLTDDRYVAVEIRVPEALARLVASRMLMVDEPLVEDLVDAVAELGNMAGGNIKAVVYGHSRLSLPTALLSEDHIVTHDGEVVVRVDVLGQVCELAVYPVAGGGDLEWPPYDASAAHGALS